MSDIMAERRSLPERIAAAREAEREMQTATNVHAFEAALRALTDMIEAAEALSVALFAKKQEHDEVVRLRPLFAVANEMHGTFDEQCQRHTSQGPHDEDEYCVTVTWRQVRELNEAILKAEGKLR